PFNPTKSSACGSQDPQALSLFPLIVPRKRRSNHTQAKRKKHSAFLRVSANEYVLSFGKHGEASFVERV
ncbi:MAG: hypothetical protein ACOX83_06940, partial [Candidatus Spyradocola sp.]